jgi:hypothetical protein
MLCRCYGAVCLAKAKLPCHISGADEDLFSGFAGRVHETLTVFAPLIQNLKTHGNPGHAGMSFRTRVRPFASAIGRFAI